MIDKVFVVLIAGAFAMCAFHMVIVERELDHCRKSFELLRKEDAKKAQMVRKLSAELELMQAVDPLGWEVSRAVVERLKSEICN